MVHDCTLEQRLQTDFGAFLEEPEQSCIVGIDLGTEGVGNLRAQQGRLFSAPLQDQPRLVSGPLFQNLEHIGNIALLVGQEFLFGKQQVGNDLVGGGNDAALVGGSVPHDDDTFFLQLDLRVGSYERVCALYDDL